MINQKQLLIVAPQWQDRDQFESILFKEYSLHIEEEFEKALIWFENNHAKTLAVFVPIMMRDQSIQDYIRRLQNVSLLSEIVAYGESAQTQDVVTAFKEGIYDFISRPLKEEAVLFALQQIEENNSIVRQIGDSSSQDLGWNRRFILYKEFMRKRRIEGKSLLPKELMALFSQQSKRFSDRESAGSPSPTDIQEGHILIVEDEPDFLNLLNTILSPLYSTHKAGTGQEALVALEQIPEIRIMVLDIGLPDQSGVEVLEKSQAMYPLVDVIILTAHDEIELAIQTLKKGASDFLNKPFLRNDLLSTVSKLIQRQYLKQIVDYTDWQKEGVELPFNERIQILNEIGSFFKSKAKTLLMADIYLFFPELKKTNIPDAVVIPSHILARGLDKFVDELMAKMPLFNPTDL